MIQRSLDSVSHARGTLLCGLTPSGCVEVHPGSLDEGPGLSTVVQRRIIDAFNAGRGHGVLHLGAGELSTDLHPTMSYWRDIGGSFVARVCGALDPTDPTSLVIPGPDPDEIAAFSEAVPPMRGAELLTPALLGDLWTDIGTALRVEVGRFKDGGVQGYLKKQSSVWNVVGRVCVHLADNKRDRDYPFAFIATYVHKVSKQATPQHLPLGQALKEYAGAKNRQNSCCRFWANQLRVLLTAVAYVLMQELRLRAARTACARTQVTWLRDRLLKLGAHVVGSARRTVLHLPTATPDLHAWRRIALALGARPG